MAWVKRNLVFVIIVAIGLIATGYCGYLLHIALDANVDASAKFTDAQGQLKTEQDSKPPATPENIAAAKADQERVRTFLADFRKAFSPFPTAPTVDDKRFVEHLQITLRQFAAEVTNAGVQLQGEYYYSFSQQRTKMTFSPECIPVWMQEIEQIKVILRILCDCKINYLESIQRVPACMDDNDGNDVIQASPGSNTWGVVMPYRIAFRSFSTELASVLASFADSTNCFIVKYVNVQQSKTALPLITEAAPTQAPVQRYMQREDYNRYGTDGEEGGRFNRRRGSMPQTQQQIVVAPTGPPPPETILQELPLYVTLVVDAVNLKSSEK
jgi:hypothetical protein